MGDEAVSGTELYMNHANEGEWADLKQRQMKRRRQQRKAATYIRMK